MHNYAVLYIIFFFYDNHSFSSNTNFNLLWRTDSVSYRSACYSVLCLIVTKVGT